jgi:phosphoserine phosphatase RsbU/P
MSISPSLARFLRQQIVYLAVGLLTTAVFWSIGLPINPATAMLYSFCLGNLMMPVIERVHCAYGQRPFPINWLILLLAIVLLTPPVYIISSVVVWLLAPPAPQSLLHLILVGWKLPCLLVFVVAIVSILFSETKEQLERQNVELQRSIDQSAAQLVMQDQELQRAREIQQSLLLKNIPQLPGCKIATTWHPARMVGGDYFDVLQISEYRIAICIADVVGKGVSAALLMANVQAAVRAFATTSESPASLCRRVNHVLCENLASGKFVTFFYGVLDEGKYTFEYCDAGHPYPLLVSQGFRATALCRRRGAGRVSRGSV